jgi:hypothetical protein
MRRSGANSRQWRICLPGKYSPSSQWDPASSYYDAAAAYVLDEQPSSADASTRALDPILKPQLWLVHAGALACFGGNRDRIFDLDRRIRSTDPYFRHESQEPSWEIWRYLMARWWSSLSEKDKSLSNLARLEADDALEKLLRQPVAIDPTRGNPWNSTNDAVHAPSVQALNGLEFGRQLSGGVFPASSFIKSLSEVGGAATPLLYRSILEYVARAERNDSPGRIADTRAFYAMAADMAAELTQRLPNSGAFLEMAVLRAEVGFLQGHQLNPVQVQQLTKRADSLRVAAACNDATRNAYRDAPKTLVQSKEYFQQQTFLGPVPLLCPFSPPLASVDVSATRN